MDLGHGIGTALLRRDAQEVWRPGRASHRALVEQSLGGGDAAGHRLMQRLLYVRGDLTVDKRIVQRFHAVGATEPEGTSYAAAKNSMYSWTTMSSYAPK